MATKLILIRHGETVWNSKRRYCGSIDVALNNKGKKQARSLRNRLKGHNIHSVYSSDKKRAVQTAKIIFKGLKIKKFSQLNEINFGIFEGLSHEQIMKKYPAVYKQWQNNPLNSNIPKGESLRDFEKRVIAIFKRIISLNRNKTVAIVSHGGPISVFINRVLKARDFWKYIPNHASLTIVEFENRKPKIRLLNDLSHLSAFAEDHVHACG